MTTRNSAANRFAMPLQRLSGPLESQRFIFDPESWVELAYPCTFRHEKPKEHLRRFTEKGLHEMAAAFHAEREKNPDYSLLVNFDHLALDAANRTEAAGWLTDLKVERCRLYGKIKWSSLGMEAAQGGVYRYVSVEVYDTSTPEEAWAEKGAEWNRLTGVAVTNDPALKNLRPFCFRADGEAEEDGHFNKKEHPETGRKEPTMEQIRKALGLPEDATSEVVVAAITERTALIEELKTKLETQQSRIGELEATAVESAAAAFSAKHGSRFKSADDACAFYRAAPGQAEELLAKIKVVDAVASPPITHRRAGTPEGHETTTPAQRPVSAQDRAAASFRAAKEVASC